ncbi:MAG TPA: hypothetical protein VMN39_06830 [Longimicrobiaceae bacterium]|nr:hypothetical protein [Longimicrobiaceae bacterium]
MNRDRRHQTRVIVYRAKVDDAEEPYEAEYSAIADALHFACRDLRESRRVPIEILEDGVTIYDAAGIAAACAERMAELTREHGLTNESMADG